MCIQLEIAILKCFGHEIEFNNSSDYKPIQMSLFDDKEVEITGKIDRVDLGKIGDKQYIRVIDYKSSDTSIDLTKVKAGLQIQLVTYLDALTEKTEYELGGVLYLNLLDNIYKASKNEDPERIEEEIRKLFRMKGLVVADVQVIKAMDKNIEESGSSDIIPVTLKKDGNIYERQSSTIGAEEFKELQKSVRKVIKQLSSEIMKGNIDIKPYSYNDQTGCEYCVYRSICNFNTSLASNEYNYIKK